MLASIKGFGQAGNTDGCKSSMRFRIITGTAQEPIVDVASIICVGDSIRASSCTGQAASYNMGKNPADTTTTAGIDTTSAFNYPAIYSILQNTLPPGPHPPGSTPKPLFLRRNLYVMPKTTPRVSINYCEGRSIQVRIADTDPAGFTIRNFIGDSDTTYTQFYNRYVVNFGNGESRTITSRDTAFIYEYATPNTYTVTVQGLYPGANCGGTYTETIRTGRPIVAPDLAEVRVLDQSGTINRIQATATLLNYLSYQVNIRYGNGNWIAVDTLAALGGINTEERTQTVELPIQVSAVIPCVKLTALNPCAAGLDSKTICASILTAQTNPAAGTNTVIWSGYPGPEFARYELYRDNNLIQTISQVTSTTFTDADVLCGVNYCYRLVVKLSSRTTRNEELQSISDTACVTTRSTRAPQAISAPGSTVTNSQAEVNWNAPNVPVGEYRIFRNGAYIGATTTTTFTDPVARPNERSYCYTIRFTDVCGNVAEQSTETCTIWLSGQAVEETYQLTWTPYRGQTTSIGYVVEYLNSNNQVYRTEETGSTLSYNDQEDDANPQIIRYRIRAVSDNGETLSYSNIIERRLEPRLFFPEAFSPNGDGQNDLFRPFGAYIENFELVVYNRWGEVVYSYRGSFPGEGEGWDGNTYGGRPAPTGLYQYTATAIDAIGSRKQVQGKIMLIR